MDQSASSSQVSHSGNFKFQTLWATYTKVHKKPWLKTSQKEFTVIFAKSLIFWSAEFLGFLFCCCHKNDKWDQSLTLPTIWDLLTFDDKWLRMSRSIIQLIGLVNTLIHQRSSSPSCRLRKLKNIYGLAWEIYREKLVKK